MIFNFGVNIFKLFVVCWLHYAISFVYLSQAGCLRTRRAYHWFIYIGHTEHKQHFAILRRFHRKHFAILRTFSRLDLWNPCTSCENDLWNYCNFIKINLWDSDKSSIFAAVNQKVTHYDIQTQTV